MGTSRNPQEFLAKIDQLGSLAETVAAKATKANAQLAAKNAEAEARQATGGDLVLSHAGKLVRNADGRVTGRGGGKIRVSVKPTDDKLYRVSAEGPWPLINNDLKAHYVGPAGEGRVERLVDGVNLAAGSGRKTAKARVGRAKAIKTPYGLKRWALIPKKRGKKLWQRAAKQTETQIASGATVARIAQQEMQRVFR